MFAELVKVLGVEGAIVFVVVSLLLGLAAFYLIVLCLKPAAASLVEEDDGEEDDEEDEDEEDEDEEDEEDEEDDNSVYDVDDAADEDLSFKDDEVAALYFFYAEHNEVCADLQAMLKAFAAPRTDGLAVFSVNAMLVNCLPLVVLYGVRDLPTFVFRRKGDVGYHTLVGKPTEQQLSDFVNSRLQEPDPVGACS